MTPLKKLYKALALGWKKATLSLASFAILAFFCTPPWPLWAEDRRSNTSVLVIMTLNAEFLWDGVSPEEGRVDFDCKHSQTEAEEHMRRMSSRHSTVHRFSAQKV